MGSASSHSSVFPDGLFGHHHAPPMSTPSRSGNAPSAPATTSPGGWTTKRPLRSFPAPNQKLGIDWPPAPLARRLRSFGPDISIFETANALRYTAAVFPPTPVVAAG